MRRSWRAALGVSTIALMALMGGCVVMRLSRAKPSPSRELIFSHERHARMEIECGACHTAATSLAASDNLLPDESSCMTCHHRSQGCELCHRDASRAVRSTPRDLRLRFPHAVHLKAKVNPEGCPTCHRGVEQTVSVGTALSITERTCLSCHRNDMSSGPQCGSCHSEFTAKTFLPVSHNSNWLGDHAKAPVTTDGLCDVCHRGTIRADSLNGPKIAARPVVKNHAVSGNVHDCADCHRADLWSKSVHDDNYLQTHPLDASLDTTTCESCHQRDECKSCHRDLGLNFASVHPSDFIFKHRDEAKRALGTCASCHEEKTCLTCHQATNPHPDGWDAEITTMNRSLCIKCHVGGIVTGKD